MVKGSSLLLVGSGIVLSAIFIIIIELANPLNTADDFEYFSDLDVWVSFLALGCIVVFFGGPKFLYEKQKKSEKLEPKPVSLIWQVIGSLFPGFDLLVMYRIGKLRLGSIVYAFQFAILLGLDFSGISHISSDADMFIVAIGYAIIVFIWSKRWNKQFLEDSKMEELK